MLSLRQQKVAIEVAYGAARESPDLSTQNGAVLVDPITGTPILTTAACNHLPRGVKTTDERLQRPLKYQYTEHAERGSIYLAASQGICTAGLILAAGWAACSDCGRGIIEAGISTLLRHAPPDDGAADRWRESIALADIMMAEAGIEVVEYSGKIGCAPVLRDGQPWQP
jgi:dCMP deaminase